MGFVLLILLNFLYLYKNAHESWYLSFIKPWFFVALDGYLKSQFKSFMIFILFFQKTLIIYSGICTINRNAIGMSLRIMVRHQMGTRLADEQPVALQPYRLGRKRFLWKVRRICLILCNETNV